MVENAKWWHTFMRRTKNETSTEHWKSYSLDTCICWCIQMGQVRSLVARGRCVQHLHVRGLHDVHRRCEFCAYMYMSHLHDIHVCARFTPALVTSANLTQMLRAPAAWGARNNRCYLWAPLYVECRYIKYNYTGELGDPSGITIKYNIFTLICWYSTLV
jgi:hypothetical protein